MSYNEKKKAANAKWDAENVDRMSLVLRKGIKDRIKAAIDGDPGMNVNKFITQAILEKLEGAVVPTESATVADSPVAIPPTLEETPDSEREAVKGPETDQAVHYDADYPSQQFPVR